MNIKRLVILAGTICFGLTITITMLWLLSSPQEIAFAAGSWYVAPSGNDSNSCHSTDKPCATINGAISKASGGNTIYVATGTYTDTGNEVVLIDKDITLSGGWDAAFTSQSDTSTIDGEGVRRGIYANSEVTATVETFTVQHGYTGDGNGGGIYNNGTITITNSTIRDNYAYFTGYNDHGGGGIFNLGVLTLIESTVNNNIATDSGGGIYATSGASNIIIDTYIYANQAYNNEGGGIQMDYDCNLSMYGGWVVGNVAHGNEVGGLGVMGGSAYIENSIIAGNFAGGGGGGLYFSQSGDYRLINSHIVGNQANGDGAAILGRVPSPSQALVTNTLIISNTGNTGIDSQWDTETTFYLNYCDTYGNSPDGTDGVTITRTNCLGTLPEDGLDPLMAGGALPSGVGPAYAEEWLSYDYRLLPGSPAIDAGTPIDAPVTDIEGNPRDDRPDLGAYECQGICPVVMSITPNLAFANSGDLPVVISGYNLFSPISAQLDGISLLNPTLVSSTTLNAEVPVNSLEVGVYDLVVTSDGVPVPFQDAFTVGFAGPWYVAPGGDDGNDCLSPAAPCATINGALNKPGFLADSTILVAEGMYTGTSNEVVLLDKSVTLSGGWDAAFTSQSGTSTIDGEDVRRGIYVNSEVTATVETFTVKQGYTGDGNGGGIYNNGILTVTNSIINDNFAYYDGYGSHGGGGIYNISSLTLINSVVSNNVASDGGGGIYGINDSSIVIVASKIFANTAINVEGGGIKFDNGSSLNMSRSWVVGNSAVGNDGGGVGCAGGSAYIENSIIAGNFSDRTGGGLWLGGGPHIIVNSNIVGNEANEDGAAISLIDTQIEITNTLIISNTGITGIDSQWDAEAAFHLSYCDTYGNSPDGTVGVTIIRNNCLGNPQEDGLDPMIAGGALPVGVGPAFAEQWLSFDYHLLPGSPAVDTGTPIGAPVTDIEGAPRDLKPDMGAYENHHIYLPLVYR